MDIKDNTNRNNKDAEPDKKAKMKKIAMITGMVIGGAALAGLAVFIGYCAGYCDGWGDGYSDGYYDDILSGDFDDIDCDVGCDE